MIPYAPNPDIAAPSSVTVKYGTAEEAGGTTRTAHFLRRRTVGDTINVYITGERGNNRGVGAEHLYRPWPD